MQVHCLSLEELNDMEKLSHQDITRVLERAENLISEKEVNLAIDRVAAEIGKIIKNEVPVLLCVMKGGQMFTSALMQRIRAPMMLDYVHVDRYRNETQGGGIHWHKEPDTSLKDRMVIVVDDILDEGYTLQALIAYCKSKKAKEVFSTVLLKKKLNNMPRATTADFIGLEVEDRYVFGWGMDYKGYLRNQTSIYALAQGDD